MFLYGMSNVVITMPDETFAISILMFQFLMFLRETG